MEELKPGAESQVFSSGQKAGEPANWYPENENMAGPDGKDVTPKPSEEKEPVKEPEEKEALEEKEPEKEPEKKEAPEKKVEDADKDKDKKENRETFRKSFEKADVRPIPERRAKHPKMEDGDYTIEDDGEVTVHAQHIVDDYESIIKDVKTYFKIYKSKGNQNKAEFIAEKLLGFEGDGVRSAGRVAFDVLDAYNNAETDEDAQRIVEDFFPSLLKDSEAESNVSFSPKEEAPEGTTGAETDDGGITQKDAVTALKVWSADSGVSIDAEKALDDPDLLDAYNGNRFDAETGEEMPAEERMMLAADIVFGEESKDAPIKEITSGGAKKGERPAKKDAAKAEEKPVFTSSKKANVKSWY